jgi:hypothetical protein
MDPLKFEGLVADYYRRQGYRVVECGTGGTKGRFDGGIDLKLYRDDEYIVVQCKRYTNSVVKHNDVHQLLGIMHTEGATRAIFINSGEYSRHALKKLQGIPNFQMIDGVQLREMFGSTEVASEPIAVRDRIEPTFGPTARRSAAGQWQDYALTIPNARPSGVTYRRPEREKKPDRNAWILVVAAIGLLMGSCIRHFSHRSNEPQPAMSRAVASPLHASSFSEASGVKPIPIQPRDTPRAVVTPHQPTQAEIREQQRKADEAMEILKKNTPEM